MTKYIPLSQGKFAAVDDEDFEWLSQWKWWYMQGYATRTTLSGSRKTKRTWDRVLMHRLIVDAPEGVDVDHRDLDGLNNQRSNLRTASRTQNTQNRGKFAKRECTSRFKGVCRRPENGRWRAYIRVHGRMNHLGTYTSEEDAARAYDAAAKEYFGEFARTNFE